MRVELDVKFDFDKSRVREESYSDIKNLADFMQQYPQTTTVVEGHTDSVGTDQYNQRCPSVAEAVQRSGQRVRRNRRELRRLWRIRPVADNSTEEGRQINRRVRPR